MIELKQVSKTFNRGEINEVAALNEVDLKIEKGTFTVLIGANGSGKTTVLNIISGAVKPSTGHVFVNGENVTKLKEHQRSKWIARVFQDPLGGTAPELSVLDNFRLAALRTTSKRLIIGVNERFKKEVRERIALLGMGLEDKLLQPMGTLSGGQRQALTLLMSVMDHTDILLLDEPTAALDPNSASVVMETARKLIEQYQLTTIFITHNLPYAQRFGDHLIQMDKGNIVRHLNTDEKAQLELNQMYAWFR